MLFTQVIRRLSKMELTLIFSLAERTATGAERTRQSISIFRTGRV